MEFEFIETDEFTEIIQELIGENEYRLLQATLIKRPDFGVVIPGGGGIRKLRWALREKGKSGGIRILYYLYLSAHQIYMLYTFKKSDQSDLNREELLMLAEYVKKHLKS